MPSDAAGREPGGGMLGAVSVGSGLVALVGVLMIGQASWEWVPGFDPAGWLRIVTGWMLPVGTLAAVATGGVALARSTRRGPAVAGISLAVVSVGIFIAMLVTHPY